jgi:hypothetical protein
MSHVVYIPLPVLEGEIRMKLTEWKAMRLHLARLLQKNFDSQTQATACALPDVVAVERLAGWKMAKKGLEAFDLVKEFWEAPVAGSVRAHVLVRTVLYDMIGICLQQETA